MTKVSLLVLSIDRVHAVFRPMGYRGRNHGRFAAVMLVVGLVPYVYDAVFIVPRTLLTTTVGVLHGNRSSSMMTVLCNVDAVTSRQTTSIGMAFVVFPDVATYVINAVLIFKVRQPRRRLSPCIDSQATFIGWRHGADGQPETAASHHAHSTLLGRPPHSSLRPPLLHCHRSERLRLEDGPRAWPREYLQ